MSPRKMLILFQSNKSSPVATVTYVFGYDE